MLDANNSDLSLLVEVQPIWRRVTFASCAGGVKLVKSVTVSMWCRRNVLEAHRQVEGFGVHFSTNGSTGVEIESGQRRVVG